MLNKQEKDNIIVDRVKTSINIFATTHLGYVLMIKAVRLFLKKFSKQVRLLIKDNWVNGTLRAGNAKDLFFLLDGVTYGPVSDSRKVIRNF